LAFGNRSIGIVDIEPSTHVDVRLAATTNATALKKTIALPRKKGQLEFKKRKKQLFEKHSRVVD